MENRTERLLENWLANTVRHCRALTLFDLEVHKLSRNEQIHLAQSCLDYFEKAAERRLKGGCGENGGLPSSCSSEEGGQNQRVRGANSKIR